MHEGKRLGHQDVVELYKQSGSIKQTAASSGLSRQTVRRILITAGEYSTPFTEELHRRREEGQSVDTIAAELGVTRTWIVANLPYTKGAYSVGPRSSNAIHIAERRQRRRERAERAAREAQEAQEAQNAQEKEETQTPKP